MEFVSPFIILGLILCLKKLKALGTKGTAFGVGLGIVLLSVNVRTLITEPRRGRSETVVDYHSALRTLKAKGLAGRDYVLGADSSPGIISQIMAGHTFRETCESSAIYETHKRVDHRGDDPVVFHRDARIDAIVVPAPKLRAQARRLERLGWQRLREFPSHAYGTKAIILTRPTDSGNR